MKLIAAVNDTLQYDRYKKIRTFLDLLPKYSEKLDEMVFISSNCWKVF